MDSQATESTSRSLLRRAREHDADAWRKLTAVYGPLIYQWCRRSGLQAGDAADVVQEVFRSVATALGNFRKERPGDTFRGWLWTITRNKIRDHARAMAKRPNPSGGSDNLERLAQLPDTAPSDSNDDSGEKLRSVLARRAVALMQSDFEESTWQAFWRVAVESQSPQTVAEQLGISVAAVYMAKSRVLRRLREELDGLDLLD